MQDSIDETIAVQKALNKAKSVDDIMAVVQSAKMVLGMGEEAKHAFWGLFPLALNRAYKIDMEHLSVQRLERDWIEATKDSDWPVSHTQIEEKRAEAKRRKVLDPMAKRHSSTIKSAKTPEELLEILHEVSRSDTPEIDHLFRETAVAEAFRAACLLDPDAPATDELGRALNALHSETVGREVDLASVFRDRQAELMKSRKAAARKLAEKPSK